MMDLGDSIEQDAARGNPVVQSLLETRTWQSREIIRLRDALVLIRNATDPDGENYRADDREGCLDMVFACASEAIKR